MSELPGQTEVLVAGAGPLGLAVAASLAGHGSMYGIELAALEGVTTPVLLSRGAASPALFEPVLERLAATLPRVERHRFAQAGHLPHVSHPEEYLAAQAGTAAQTPRTSGEPLAFASARLRV